MVINQSFILFHSHWDDRMMWHEAFQCRDKRRSSRQVEDGPTCATGTVDGNCQCRVTVTPTDSSTSSASKSMGSLHNVLQLVLKQVYNISICIPLRFYTSYCGRTEFAIKNMTKLFHFSANTVAPVHWSQGPTCRNTVVGTRARYHADLRKTLLTCTPYLSQGTCFTEVFIVYSYLQYLNW